MTIVSQGQRDRAPFSDMTVHERLHYGLLMRSLAQKGGKAPLYFANGTGVQLSPTLHIRTEEPRSPSEELAHSLAQRCRDLVLTRATSADGMTPSRGYKIPMSDALGVGEDVLSSISKKDCKAGVENRAHILELGRLLEEARLEQALKGARSGRGTAMNTGQTPPVAMTMSHIRKELAQAYRYHYLWDLPAEEVLDPVKFGNYSRGAYLLDPAMHSKQMATQIVLRPIKLRGGNESLLLTREDLAAITAWREQAMGPSWQPALLKSFRQAPAVSVDF